MDSHTHSAFGRLEVVETGRRRRWSEDEKVRIVLESLAGPRLVSATARRHGIARSQLLAWRRTLRAERSDAAPGFVPDRECASESSPLTAPHYHVSKPRLNVSSDQVTAGGVL